MPEEKEKEPQTEEKEDDPLAELLFEEEDKAQTGGKESSAEAQSESEEIVEGEEDSQDSPPGGDQEGEKTPEESSTAEKVASEEEPAEKEESDEKDESQKGEAPVEDDDPLAEILGEDLEEEAPDSSGPVEQGEQEEPEEAEETGEDESAPRKGFSGLILFLLAILVPLIFLGAGLAALWYLYQHPPLPVSQVKAPLPAKAPEKPEAPGKPETPLTTSPIAVEDRKILLLKNFLIPYRRETGEFVFVKAKVLLYFANAKEYEIATRNETIFREEIYRLFKNAPLYVWESKRGAEVLRREIKEYLTKKKIAGVIPEDLEVTGYILK